MSKRTDPAVIGAFVVGALVLVTAAIVLWGSGRLFRETAKYVGYFDGSVEGLEVGAPVKARGVTIGRVVGIQLRFRQAPTEDRIPVFVEIDLKRIVGLGGLRPEPRVLSELFARGMRARLEPQSLVTGALFINFVQVPEVPLRFTKIDPEHGYPEIPTAPTELAQLGRSLKTIVAQLEAIDFAGIARSFDRAVSAVDHLASTANLPRAINAITATMDSYQALGRRLNSDIPPLLADLQGAVGDARKALVGMDGAAGAAQRLAAPEAPLSVQLNETLGDVSRAAGALRQLAEYLQRNPNSLLVGKSR
jgi:paraquat-inducible protein B